MQLVPWAMPEQGCSAPGGCWRGRCGCGSGLSQPLAGWGDKYRKVHWKTLSPWVFFKVFNLIFEGF